MEYIQKVKQNRKITVEPRFFDSKLLTHIYNKLNGQLSGLCSQEHGYIISVKPKIRIVSNEINMYGIGMFEVRCILETYLPKVGQKLEGVVCLVVEQCVLLDVMGVFKVMIPESNLVSAGYVYDQVSKTFRNKVGDEIEHGKTIETVLETIQYENGQFVNVGTVEYKEVEKPCAKKGNDSRVRKRT